MSAERIANAAPAPAPVVRTAARRSLAAIACWVSIAAAALYGLAPLTYTYFGVVPFFQGFPTAAGRAMDETVLAIAFRKTWGEPPAKPFAARDVTCDLQPLMQGSGPGCARVIPGGGTYVYGPYVRLDRGIYRAEFDVEAAPACVGELSLDVLALEMSKRPVEITSVRLGGNLAVLMDFKVGDQAAGRIPFEFRATQTRGAPCATLRRVRLSRLATL